jgi:hypothetical protein
MVFYLQNDRVKALSEACLDRAYITGGCLLVTPVFYLLNNAKKCIIFNKTQELLLNLFFKFCILFELALFRKYRGIGFFEKSGKAVENTDLVSP